MTAAVDHIADLRAKLGLPGWWFDLTQRQRVQLVTANSPHYIYRCYDAEGLLLYIGCTHDPKRRIASHRWSRNHTSRALVALMDRHEVDADVYPDQAGGRAAEAEAIRRESPLLNLQQRQQPIRHRDLAVAEYLTDRGLPLSVAGLHRCPKCDLLLGAHVPAGLCQDCRGGAA